MSHAAVAPRFPACILATVVVPWTVDDGLEEGLFQAPYEGASPAAAAAFAAFVRENYPEWSP